MAGYSDEPYKLLPSPGPATLPRQLAAGLAAGPGGTRHHAIVPVPALLLGSATLATAAGKLGKNEVSPFWGRQHPWVLLTLTARARGCSVPCRRAVSASPNFCGTPCRCRLSPLHHGAEDVQIPLGPTSGTPHQPFCVQKPL